MLKIELVISSEYGVMFLYDGRRPPQIPETVGVTNVAVTESCIAFTVLGYVDGDARISISNNAADADAGCEIFKGAIFCPSKILSIFDSSGFCFASVPLSSEYAHIALVASERNNPDWVHCTVSNLISF